MKTIGWKSAAGIATVFFVGWCVFVNRSGAGDYWFGDKWNFTVTGQLGDSFGVVSAISATIAAVFAYKAATESKTEADRLRNRERERDDRELRRNSEDIFFRLLDQRFKIASDLTFAEGNVVHSGLHAAERMVREIRKAKKQSKKSYRQEFAYLYRRNPHELAHYFRFTYHIIKYLDSNFYAEDAYRLTSILRAQLSTPEQILLGLNAISTHGVEKMKPLVEKFAMLHSLPTAERRRYGFDRQFEASAFDRPV